MYFNALTICGIVTSFRKQNSLECAMCLLHQFWRGRGVGGGGGGGRFNGSHAGAIPFLRGRRAAHETVRFTEVRVVLVRVKPTISSVC